MNSRYTIIIQWSAADQCYVLSLPEWGEFCHTHGDIYEEALANAQEVLELLIGGLHKITMNHCLNPNTLGDPYKQLEGDAFWRSQPTSFPTIPPPRRRGNSFGRQ